MNAKQQREWEDDVTQPCAFPEPLAEVLTRENRELRAKVEYWKGRAENAWEHIDLIAFRADRAEAIAADATTAAQNLRDELQGAQERLRRVRELHVRRPWHWARDSVTFGQSDYPDRCDHCHRDWPCETATALDAEP